MKYAVLVMGLLVMSAGADNAGRAQSARSLVSNGNSQYHKENYTDAEVNYRKALEKEPGLFQGHFNLGNSLYKQKKFAESNKEFENALHKSEEKRMKAEAYYNRGNSLMKAQNYQDAITSYIESLKLTPNDPDTKYNLSYALEKLRQQQQQNKNDKNKNSDQKKNDQQKQDQQRQQKQEQQQEQRQQAQQEKKMSKADAERILDVLKNKEKDVQKKLRTRQAVRVKPDKDW